MIGISTIEQNTNGAVLIDLDPTPLKANVARVQRTATLDGGAVLSHLGYSDSDRTITVKGKMSEADFETIWEIFKIGELINVSIDDGFFRAAIESLEIDNSEINMRILLGESLSE